MGPEKLVTWTGDPRKTTWAEVKSSVLEALGRVDEEVGEELKYTDRMRELKWQAGIPDVKLFARGRPFEINSDYCWDHFIDGMACTTATSKIYLRLVTNRPQGRTAITQGLLKAMHDRQCKPRKELLEELERQLHTEAIHLDGNSGHLDPKVKWAPGGQKFIRMSAAIIHGWGRAILANPTAVTLDIPPVGRAYVWEWGHREGQTQGKKL
ncbi:hypothetical protein PGTUg99_009552 [Puccinia graminis f. sp. tritici]|uniref:Uncharacterized protein n=1 Tax=Puccinia graminis f. sp. tritici TaxID=56615 RepID=A0A5B0MHF4_PUCGR|nr:hypothetical protein PGTUg99_009552 [Puccinia graminis f. sp. tritici]